MGGGGGGGGGVRAEPFNDSQFKSSSNTGLSVVC